jgi:DNA polymerase-3 subunit delta
MGTASLFGSGPKRVILREADALVSRDRKQLEAYAGHEGGRSTLMLEVESLPSNTNLYKSIAEHGWLIVCRPPESKTSRSKEPDIPRMKKWLSAWAQKRHSIQLSREALSTLTDLMGWEFGLLDQELAKLALFVDPEGTVSAELVRQVVGGWRTETTWEMLEAAADGDSATALSQLDHLLQAGEAPLALFGSTAWFLRRFAAATRIVQQQERQGQKVNLSAALVEAGFRKWPPEALTRATSQLRQLTRQRGSQLFEWLLQTDLALKGTHSNPARSRWAMEQLILRLAKHQRQS